MADRRHTTIADVAALAGVGSMTVSRVLNHQANVSDGVRTRVLAAARELDYSPNLLARSLKGNPARVVGILLPDIANAFACQLATSIQRTLDQHDYRCFMSTIEFHPAQESSALQTFVDHRVAGVITATAATPRGNEMLARMAERLPVVAIGRDFEHSAIDSVDSDEYQGARSVTEHLLALGHKRIAFIGARPKSVDPRFRGFAGALAARDIAFEPPLVVGSNVEAGEGQPSHEDGYRGFVHLMSLPSRPTAILARNDFAAMGALNAAAQQGISVPGEVAIAGFDNLPHSAYTAPSLTTVEQPGVEQGRQAALLLLNRMQNGADHKRQVTILDCRLIVRQSTKSSL